MISLCRSLRAAIPAISILIPLSVSIVVIATQRIRIRVRIRALRIAELLALLTHSIAVFKGLWTAETEAGRYVAWIEWPRACLPSGCRTGLSVCCIVSCWVGLGFVQVLIHAIERVKVRIL